MWPPCWEFNLGPDSLHRTGFSPPGSAVFRAEQSGGVIPEDVIATFNRIIKCKKCCGSAAPPDSRELSGISNKSVNSTSPHMFSYKWKPPTPSQGPQRQRPVQQGLKGGGGAPPGPSGAPCRTPATCSPCVHKEVVLFFFNS